MDKGDHKKISFGFSKLSRKTNLIQKPLVELKKIELIDCVEDQSIKIVGGEESKEIAPLVIPMRNPNKKLLNLEAIVKNDFKDDFEDDKPVVKTEEVTEELKPDENLSLDELAARELLKDLKNGQVKKEVIKVISVPVTEKVVFEGEKESTLEDYDDIPVKDFGLAVLRGMGWKDGEGIGKNSKVVKTTQPNLRPKGMGLGADRIAKQNIDAKPAVDKEGKALACVKGAYIKIIAGYHKGFYGQIIGFDEESGRFIIKTALNNLNLSLNEFLVTPVTREEYNKNSKVINNEKYEEYIKNKNIKKEKSRSPSRSPEGPRIPETAIKKENNHKDLSDEEKNRNSEDTKIIPDIDIKTETSSPDKEDETKHNSPNQSDHNSSSRDRAADQRSDSYSKSERPSYPNNRDSTDRGRSSKQQESSDNNRNRRHRSVSREKYNRNSDRLDNRRESRDGSNDRRYDRTSRNVDGSDNRRHLSRDDSERRTEGRSRTEQNRRNKYEDSHNEAADTKYGDRSDSRQSRTCRKSKNPDKKTRDRTESESDSDDGNNTPVVASGSRHSDKSVHRKPKHLDDSDGDSKHSSKHLKPRNADKARKNKNSNSSDESSGDDSKKKKRKSKRKHSMSDSSDDDSDDSSSSEDRKKHRKRKSKKNASDSSGDEKQKKCKKRDRSKTRKHKNKKKEKHRKRN